MWKRAHFSSLRFSASGSLRLPVDVALPSVDLLKQLLEGANKHESLTFQVQRMRACRARRSTVDTSSPSLLFLPVLRIGGRAQINIGSPLTRKLELRRFCPRSVYKPVFGMTARLGNTGFCDWTGIMQPLAPSADRFESCSRQLYIVKTSSLWLPTVLCARPESSPNAQAAEKPHDRRGQRQLRRATH